MGIAKYIGSISLGYDSCHSKCHVSVIGRNESSLEFRVTVRKKADIPGKCVHYALNLFYVTSLVSVSLKVMHNNNNVILPISLKIGRAHV